MSLAIFKREDGGDARVLPDVEGAPRIHGELLKLGIETSLSAALGIAEVLTARRSPLQNPYVKRLIGSMRQECLDHMIVLNERHLRRVLGKYLLYYHQARTHLSLCKDSPESRPVQPPAHGEIVEFPEAGGLHHRYERRAA